MAIQALKYRYRQGGRHLNPSLETNVAVVILMLKNGTYTLPQIGESGSYTDKTKKEYGHAEARALSKAIREAKKVQGGGLEECQEYPENSGPATKEMFDNWAIQLPNIQKIIIFSDRSPCSSCKPFLENLCSKVDTTMFFDTLYVSGSFGQLDQHINDAKLIVDQIEKDRFTKEAEVQEEFVATSSSSSSTDSGLSVAIGSSPDAISVSTSISPKLGEQFAAVTAATAAIATAEHEAVQTASQGSDFSEGSRPLWIPPLTAPTKGNSDDSSGQDPSEVAPEPQVSSNTTGNSSGEPLSKSPKPKPGGK